MKKLVLFIAVLIVLCVSGAYAQKQSGVVKTRGRMVNGKLVPGTLLPGATVQVEGRQAVVAKNGKFSFPVKDGKYMLKSVSKQGYNLVDEGVCRLYEYSANTLYIVMEQPDKLQSDQLAKERKLRRELQRRIQQREDEIDALNVSVEEKNKLLVQLNKQREENENIIKDMAAYYATLDYDQLDAFQQRVSALLEDCQLERADSLLRTRGDIYQRVSRIKDEQAAIAREQAALAKRKKALEESKAGTQKKMRILAADCYSFYQRFFMAHQNDSAAHYLELRASLDTNEIQWQLEAGDFIRRYLFDANKVILYNQRTLRLTMAMYGDCLSAISAYDQLASLYTFLGNLPEAENQISKGIAMAQRYLDKDHYGNGYLLVHQGQIYEEQDKNNEALECYNKALLIFEKNNGKESSEVAQIYGNIANAYCAMGDYTNGLLYYKKDYDFFNQPSYAETMELAVATIRIAGACINAKDFEMAKDYVFKANEISLKVFGDKEITTGSSFYTLGKYYYNIGEYEMALTNCRKAEAIYEEKLGPENNDTRKIKAYIEEIEQKLAEQQQSQQQQTQSQ